MGIAVVNYRPYMESTKKLLDKIPVEISMGGINIDSHTRGCSNGPLSLLFNEQFLACNFCVICDQLSMGRRLYLSSLQV